MFYLFLEKNVSQATDDCEVEENCVRSMFSKFNTRKACGPDGLSGKRLRFCADRLCWVLSRLFTWSLRDCIVPTLWKNSTICPVPKNNTPKSMNDYRPVALTSLVIKVIERIVLSRLHQQVEPFLDPNQYAYKSNRSTTDATLALVHNIFEHLETLKSFVRILFIDFSSAFNTIQPHLLANKFLSYDVDCRTILWIMNFLVNRSQCIRFESVF